MIWYQHGSEDHVDALPAVLAGRFALKVLNLGEANLGAAVGRSNGQSLNMSLLDCRRSAQARTFRSMRAPHSRCIPPFLCAMPWVRIERHGVERSAAVRNRNKMKQPSSDDQEGSLPGGSAYR